MPPKSIMIEVDTAMQDLLRCEDTDGDGLITIDDNGPKQFPLGNYCVHASEKFDVEGTYQLSNLLQELFHARRKGCRAVLIERLQLEENPVRRLSRLIKESWWDNLTRRMDASGIEMAAKDPKMISSSRVYVPPEAPEQYAYYCAVARDQPSIGLEVHWLPQGEITAEFIKSINVKPGILALEMEEVRNEELQPNSQLQGLPFIVPGGCFNELYNWDSCFCALGMFQTHLHVVKGIVRNFIFEIKHYGKILNANRSYYLGRAQPPLLTWLAMKTYAETRQEPGALDLLRQAILAAMKEYYSYWTSPPRLDQETGLSRYRPIGVGSPPECLVRSFAHIFFPYADKYHLTLEEVSKAYNNGTIKEPGLDAFFDHDRAVRESGHDTSNRVEGLAANLATVDLNCLLYRYETDISFAIKTFWEDDLVVPVEFSAPGQEQRVESSFTWTQRAEKRKLAINKYLWNEEEGMYFDYDTVTKQPSPHETVTGLWPLWCHAASEHQATRLVSSGIARFECPGGLSSTSEQTRGIVSDANPQKQWDYPHGWAPHQILAWDGLSNYGYHEEAERLIYRWLHMIVEIFRNYNGTVVEKYDVTRLRDGHKVDAEYENQGLGFKYAPQEGFGWTNASFLYGLSLLNEDAATALKDGHPYETYLKTKSAGS